MALDTLIYGFSEQASEYYIHYTSVLDRWLPRRNLTVHEEIVYKGPGTKAISAIAVHK